MPPTERLYTIIAKAHPETRAPLLGDCTLFTGYGNVELKSGRSAPDVPETVARALEQREDIEVIPTENFGIKPEPREMPADTVKEIAAAHATAEKAVQAAAEGGDMVEVEIGGQKVLVPASALLAAAGDKAAVTVAKHKTAAKKTGKKTGKAPVEPGDPDALAAARAHLEGEGEDIPDPDPATPDPAPMRVVPAGFEATTGEDEPRCLAAKADGTQCKNAAIASGPACRMEPHAKQFAAAA